MGLLDGKSVHKYQNGQPKAVVTFVDGQEEGTVTLFYPNGKKESEGTFVNGKLQGTLTYWYANGQKREEVGYANGYRSGGWRMWNEAGMVIYDGLFKNKNPFPSGAYDRTSERKPGIEGLFNRTERKRNAT